MVPLDTGTALALKRHRAGQSTERLAWGDAWHDTGLVFTREDGTPLRPQSVTRLFTQLVAETVLPTIRLHDLRHTNASMALAAGVPLKVVSQRLGHSSTAITSDLYTHVIPALARDAADRIGALITGDDEAELEQAQLPFPSAFLAQEASTRPDETA